MRRGLGSLPHPDPDNPAFVEYGSDARLAGAPPPAFVPEIKSTALASSATPTTARSSIGFIHAIEVSGKGRELSGQPQSLFAIGR